MAHATSSDLPMPPKVIYHSHHELINLDCVRQHGLRFKFLDLKCSQLGTQHLSRTVNNQRSDPISE